MRVYYHRGTGQRLSLAVPGTRFTRDGHAVAQLGEDGWEAQGVLEPPREAHVVDPARGHVSAERVVLEPEALVLALAPGMAMLRMHIPAGAHLSLEAFWECARRARSFFERLKAGVHTRGVFGEAWLLEPAIADLLPSAEELRRLRASCALYPGSLPEAKTLRRFFGSAATRENLPRLTPRSEVQRALQQYLTVGDRVLRARGGLILAEDLEPSTP